MNHCKPKLNECCPGEIVDVSKNQWLWIKGNQGEYLNKMDLLSAKINIPMNISEENRIDTTSKSRNRARARSRSRDRLINEPLQAETQRMLPRGNSRRIQKPMVMDKRESRNMQSRARSRHINKPLELEDSSSRKSGRNRNINSRAGSRKITAPMEFIPVEPRYLTSRSGSIRIRQPMELESKPQNNIERGKFDRRKDRREYDRSDSDRRSDRRDSDRRRDRRYYDRNSDSRDFTNGRGYRRNNYSNRRESDRWVERENDDRRNDRREYDRRKPDRRNDRREHVSVRNNYSTSESESGETVHMDIEEPLKIDIFEGIPGGENGLFTLISMDYEQNYIQQEVLYNYDVTIFNSFRTKEELETLLNNLKEVYDFGFINEESYMHQKEELSKELNNAYVDNMITVDYSSVKNRKSGIIKERAVRIFVSSTFRDMTDERDVIMNHVFPELKKYFYSRGILVTLVDLRWGITSDQSESGDTLKICLSEIDRCRPYFIGILGGRYGWSLKPGVPDDLFHKTLNKAGVEFPWVGNYKNRSITEIEIRHACLDGSSDDQEHSLFYMKENCVDDDTRLTYLKSEIKRNHNLNVSEYTKASSMGNNLLEQLKNLIDADFPLDKMPTPLEIERMAHVGFQELRSKVYIGGSKYFMQLNNWVNRTTGVPCVVVGPSGLGKSALMSNWCTNWQYENPQKYILSHFIGCSSVSTDLGRLLQRIMEEISQHFALELEVPNELNGLVEKFPDFLNAASRKGGMVLVIDALNQLENRDNAHSLFWLPKKYPSNIHLVLSTLPGRCFDEIEFREWKRIPVEPLTETERRQMVEQYLAFYGKSLTSNQLEMIIYSKQSQNPLYLRTILDEMRIFTVYEEVTSQIQHYLTAKTPPELFSLVFDRLEKNHNTPSNPTIISKLLSWICLSRKGLSENEIIDCLNISHSQWAPLHNALEESLVAKSGYFSFFHDYMRQAVEEKYLRNRSINGLRSDLIDFFGSLDDENRRVDEIAYQLFQFDMLLLGEFISQPSNFRVLFASHKFDLFKYWRSSVKHDPNVVETFIYQVLRHQNTSILPDAAEFLQEVGLYDAAERILQANFKVIQGNGSPLDIAMAITKLAKISRLRGLYNEAATKYEKALPILETHYDNRNLQLANILYSMGELYRHQGKYDKAKQFIQRSLKTRESVLGKSHPKVAQALDTLGIVYQDLGEYVQAMESFNNGLNQRKRYLGPDHPDVAMSHKNIADLLIIQNKFNEALQHLDISKSIYVNVYGEDHPVVAQTFNSIAALYLETGQYQQAEVEYDKVLRIKEELMGKMHPEFALTLNDYAVLCVRTKNMAKAEEMLLEALRIRLEILGSSHPDYGHSLQNLGSFYQQANDLSSAIKYFNDARSVFIGKFGNNHLDVASVTKGIAAVQQLLGNYQEATNSYDTALSITKQIFGEEHIEIAIVYNDYAVLEYRKGDVAKAQQYYELAISIYSRILGDDHSDTRTARNNLATLKGLI
eukprot:TRINITY_DN2803_c0_g1_i3.p1 TRINITY_DN2803_c0_g1~~TRINITY_DN2803_c0_g1_i3.p1  ORF type:complete len:1483 (+),score=328.80 TRINITY_DN2803_c0_g1_i3:163-4611(+)